MMEVITTKEIATEETLDIKALKFKEKTGMDFSNFYKTYYPKLKYYLYRMCYDTYLSEEAASECIEKALRQIDSYDTSRFEDGKKASFTTWVYKISKNHMLQILDKKKKSKMVSLNSIIDDEGTNLVDIMRDDSDDYLLTEQHYELAKKKCGVVVSNIENLGDAQRDVIIMRELNNMSYREISYALGQTYTFVSKTNDDYTVDLSESKLSEVHNVYNKFDKKLNYEIVEYSDVEKTYINKIKINDLYFGDVKVKYIIPENENTIKSKIRCGRLKLEELTKNDFKKLNSIYL